jgi:hypothetical protein
MRQSGVTPVEEGSCAEYGGTLAPGGSAMSRRLNVSFSQSAYATLEKLADEKGKSMSEVLRDAIALEKWMTEATKDGRKILVEHPDGKVRELITR